MYDFIFTWPQSEECLQIRVVICNSFFLIYLCNSELLMKPLAKRPNESRKYLIIFFLSNGIFDIFKIKIYSGNIYIYIAIDKDFTDEYYPLIFFCIFKISNVRFSIKFYQIIHFKWYHFHSCFETYHFHSF